MEHARQQQAAGSPPLLSAPLNTYTLREGSQYVVISTQSSATCSVDECLGIALNRVSCSRRVAFSAS